MTKILIRVVYVLSFFSCILCGCAQEHVGDINMVLSDERVRDENVYSLAAGDWIICESMFYIRTGDNTFEKGEFPSAVHDILSEEGNSPTHPIKVENRIVIECKDDFVIYDFESDSIERLELTHGHSDWQIMHNGIFFIALDEREKKHMMVYDMYTGEIEEIELGDFVPVQFCVRKDGAIGIWGSDKDSKMFCFWRDGEAVYVADKDMYVGWTQLYDYNGRGLIFEREYQSSSMKGTKIYQIQKSGELTVLASSGDASCDANDVPIGELIFEDECIMSIDFSNGEVEVFDYAFSGMEKRVWELDNERNMIFNGYYKEDAHIVGLWKDEEVIRTVELKEKSK